MYALKKFVKWLWSEKPVLSAASTGLSPCSRSRLAALRRIFSRYLYGVIPFSFANALTRAARLRAVILHSLSKVTRSEKFSFI